ncbi:MAG: phosphoenolpyruvate--protein phosphotransferase [Bifidobacteriaceae bacterium]|jgi:phosphotransferase system enzyme I (PtsI)|nr:phosphoenolpyruvate--protein phosphotransferase [Bifidobacteriaceae bacterium]
MIKLAGKAVSGGIGFGKAFVIKNVNLDIKTQYKGQTEELKALNLALNKTDEQLQTIYKKAEIELGKANADIIDIQRTMLFDPEFLSQIKMNINQGQTAKDAVLETGHNMAEIFANLDDNYMKARAIDIRDITNRITKNILGIDINWQITEDSIIFGNEITPADTLSLDTSKIKGIVSKVGSNTSHSAILARNLGVPCIINVADLNIDRIIVGQEVAIDAGTQYIYFEPYPNIRKALKKLSIELAEKFELLLKLKNVPAITKSKKHIEVAANIGGTDEIQAVLDNGAEAIGLYRSEFLFIGRAAPPSEEEQFTAFSKVVKAMSGKRVVIRTIDIGTDKIADYLNLPHEENPALGYRAIRICFDQLDIFKTHLRAILKASAFGQVAIMFPMIASSWEVRRAKEILQLVHKQLIKEGIKIGKYEIGIMIETPAAAITSDELAKEVDFFSVGTNDLTQYTLAADRGSPAMDKYINPHHPAILELLRLVAHNAHTNGIWAGICGELAGDFELTSFFIKIGIDELSVSAPKVLELKDKIINHK